MMKNNKSKWILNNAANVSVGGYVQGSSFICKTSDGSRTAARVEGANLVLGSDAFTVGYSTFVRGNSFSVVTNDKAANKSATSLYCNPYSVLINGTIQVRNEGNTAINPVNVAKMENKTTLIFGDNTCQSKNDNTDINVYMRGRVLTFQARGSYSSSNPTYTNIMSLTSSTARVNGVMHANTLMVGNGNNIANITCNDKGLKVSVPIQDYASSTELTELSNYISTTYATKSFVSGTETSIKNWVNNQGFLKSHQSLADYRKKTDNTFTNLGVSGKIDAVGPITVENGFIGNLNWEYVSGGKGTDVSKDTGYVTPKWVNDRYMLKSNNKFVSLELYKGTPFIDFHLNEDPDKPASTDLDFNVRIINSSAGKLQLLAHSSITANGANGVSLLSVQKLDASHAVTFNSTLTVKQALTASSTITATGNITAKGFYESSDKRFKTDIKLIDQDFTKVNLYQFKFKDDESQKTKYGVIAQELEELGLTNLVSENSNGIKSVDYISLLIGMVNDLRERVKLLESK